MLEMGQVQCMERVDTAVDDKGFEFSCKFEEICSFLMALEERVAATTVHSYSSNAGLCAAGITIICSLRAR